MSAKEQLVDKQSMYSLRDWLAGSWFSFTPKIANGAQIEAPQPASATMFVVIFW
jgi:hypothetical protein